MARASWLSMNPKSRQGPCGREHLHAVSPGETLVARWMSFSIRSSLWSHARALSSSYFGGCPSRANEATVHQNPRGGEARFGEGREDDDVARKLEGSGLGPPASARRLPAHLAVRNPDGLLRLYDRTDASRHGDAIADRHRRPGSQGTRALQRRGVRQQVERRTVGRPERQRSGVHPHGDMTARRDHVIEARGGRIAPVGQPRQWESVQGPCRT